MHLPVKANSLSVQTFMVIKTHSDCDTMLTCMLKCSWQCVPLDGELYYQCHRKQDEEQHRLAKVVLTPQEAEDLFVEFHASAIGAHCGVDKTLHAIHQRYYWPGMKADITKWVSGSFIHISVEPMKNM